MKFTLTDVTKVYNNTAVINHLSLCLDDAQIYVLMGASGSGKTTLLRLLLGLEKPDFGLIERSQKQSSREKIVAVFQENRLCNTFSPIENVMLAVGKQMTRSMIFDEMCRILPEESLTRPVSSLSGGMKRRVAICRALLAPSQAIVMDEPFSGLDEETKKIVIAYIREKTAGKLLVISTHQEDDVALLEGLLLHLPILPPRG